MTILMQRRGLLLGMASLLAAPAVVRAESLMPVRGEPLIQRVLMYWYHPVDSFQWQFGAETQFLTRKGWEWAAPASKDGGEYCWSNPITGEPCMQFLTGEGLIIPSLAYIGV